MYTVKQLKKRKISVFLATEEEYKILRGLGFYLCKWKGAYRYGINEETYSSCSSLTDFGAYGHGTEYTNISFSDICFGEQYELY